jgi:hypothetical protein
VKDVSVENITGKDVTADYVDQQSRLTNLLATEKQLQRIQEGAVKTEDVLSVFNQLVQVRQQIEQIKGQIKFYEESAAMSAISITLIARASVVPITIAGWEPVGVARDAFQTLINVGKSLAEIIIWLVIFFLPLGLVFYFPGRWLYRWGKKAFARPQPVGYPPYTAAQAYPMQGMPPTAPPNPPAPPAN